LRLIEGAGGGLASEHEHPAAEQRRCDAAARRGHRGALLPTIGCGIIVIEGEATEIDPEQLN